MPGIQGDGRFNLRDFFRDLFSIKQENVSPKESEILNQQDVIQGILNTLDQQLKSYLGNLRETIDHPAVKILNQHDKKIAQLSKKIKEVAGKEFSFKSMEEDIQTIQESLLKIQDADASSIEKVVFEFQQNEHISLIKRDIQFINRYVEERLELLHEAAKMNESEMFAKRQELVHSVKQPIRALQKLVEDIQVIAKEELDVFKEAIEPLRHQYVGEALDVVDDVLDAGKEGIEKQQRDVAQKINALREEVNVLALDVQRNWQMQAAEWQTAVINKLSNIEKQIREIQHAPHLSDEAKNELQSLFAVLMSVHEDMS